MIYIIANRKMKNITKINIAKIIRIYINISIIGYNIKGIYAKNIII